MPKPYTIITQTPVTENSFVSSTIPENDHNPWSPLVTYARGERVILTTGYHAIYESLVDGNIDNFPDNNPTKWVKVGPTNRWAMFDIATGTISSAPGEIVVEFAFTTPTNFIQAVALLELEAKEVSLQVLDNFTNEVLYSKRIELKDKAIVTSYYDYYYVPISLETEAVFEDLPKLSIAQKYRITIKNPGRTARIGNVVVGQRYQMGFTEYNANVGIIDYSRKEKDQFGRTTLVERRFVKRMNCQVRIPGSVVDGVADLLSRIRALPSLHIAAQGEYESLTIYGFPRDWSVDIAYPTTSFCSLQVEGI